MKRYKIIVLLFITVEIVLTGFNQTPKNNSSDDDKWSGTVSYFEKRTGPGIIISEWRMDAVIKNNEGTATNKMISQGTDGQRGECNGLGKSELDVGVDLEAKLYSIAVSIPDCNGISISPAGTQMEFVQDGAISIESQRLGKNPNVLSGSLVLRNTQPDGASFVTTYTWSLRTSCPPWKMSPLSQTNINTLDARVRDPATRFIKRVYDELCIKLKVVSATRSLAEQANIYASGRTRPGPILTNAPAGTSYHNFALAFDVHIQNDDGTIDLENEIPPEVVAIARQEGFEWGGDWPEPKRDPPHFQMTFGQTIEQLRIQHGIH